MKIGIVLHPYGEKAPAGLGRIIFELTRELIAADPNDEFVIYLKEKPKVRLDLPGSNWKIEILGGGIFWLDGLRRAEKADVYIFNTPMLPFFYRPKRSIAIALDFAYWHLPAKSFIERLRRRLILFYQRRSLKSADRIVAISEATKKDVIGLGGVLPERVRVIYFGFKSVSSLPAEPIKVPPKYFLSVGVVKERKNTLATAKAFAKFFPRHPEFSLVVAGRAEGAYAQEVKNFVREGSWQDKIIFLGHVSDRRLSYLYKNAVALVFPSLIEGFGFPILEAMQAGLPVITSNRSSLAEVGGDAAVLVDPENIEAISRAMEDLATSDVRRAELIERGRACARAFSWQKTVQEFLDIIHAF